MCSLDGVVGVAGGRESAGSAFADGPAAHAYAEAGAWDGPHGLRRAICLSVECSALDEWA